MTISVEKRDILADDWCKFADTKKSRTDGHI
jgi:hypothetical protein